MIHQNNQNPIPPSQIHPHIGSRQSYPPAYTAPYKHLPAISNYHHPNYSLPPC